MAKKQKLGDLLEGMSPDVVLEEARIGLLVSGELDPEMTLGELKAGKGETDEEKIDPATLGVSLSLVHSAGYDDHTEAYLTVMAERGKEKVFWHEGQATWYLPVKGEVR